MEKFTSADVPTADTILQSKNDALIGSILLSPEPHGERNQNHECTTARITVISCHSYRPNISLQSSCTPVQHQPKLPVFLKVQLKINFFNSIWFYMMTFAVALRAAVPQPQRNQLMRLKILVQRARAWLKSVMGKS